MVGLDWDTPEYHEARRHSYERIRDKHPTLVTRGFSCELGWFGIIGEFFDEAAAALAQAPEAQWELRQIKEKFAGLRIHYQVHLDEPPPSVEAAERFLRARQQIKEAYERAEEKAKVTCDICGRPGVMSGRGWFAIRCAEHGAGERSEYT